MIKLNNEQMIACSAPLGHNLVIASAGTGKTSTIVGRIAHLIKQGITPDKILLLTFTNKAASEMLSRLYDLFDPRELKGLEAGTFHAVSYRYLKEHKKISLKQPRELKILFKGIYESHPFKERFSTAPYGYSYLYDSYSLYQNAHQRNETNIQSFEEWLETRTPEQVFYVSTYEKMLDEFQVLKQEYGYADFNDLLILYRQEMEILRKEMEIYTEILVDEYQDTNPLQDSILKALNPQSLFCVGDYDQSIYAFNGADISIIAGFKDRFHDSKIFNLSKNYRSTAPILELANRVINRNERIYPKKLEVTKDSKEAKNVQLLAYDELFDQYKGIAEKISQSQTPLSEIAIIFRNNATADGIEACLREKHIPSKRKGGVGFFESKEVNLMLDLLSLLHNPKDMMAFVHVISYTKGVGSGVGREIYEALLKLGKGDIFEGLINPDHNVKDFYPKQFTPTLFDDVFADENKQRFKELNFNNHFSAHPILSYPKITQDIAIFLHQLYELTSKQLAKKNTLRIIEAFEHSSLFKNIIQSLAKSRATLKDGSLHPERYEQALEKIALKIKILKDLSQKYSDLGRFLNAMVLGGNEMNEGSGVNLLSIHSSKGLEYHEVYVIDLMEGRFPNHKLMNQNGHIEEERRLFYVATTRAKEILFLSFAKNDRIKQIEYKPSIFLYEAGFELTEAPPHYEE